MELTGKQIQTLRRGLEKSFVGFDQLDMFLKEETDRGLVAYAAQADTLPIAAFKVIQGAQAEGWLDKLLIGAISTRPARAEFAKVATELGLTAAGPNLTNALPIAGRPQQGALKALEDIVFGRERFVDVEKFLAEMSAAQSRICAIGVPDPEGRKLGTGFLVGPDLVLTNFHVLSRVIAGEADPADVELRFDMRLMPDGRTLRPGVVYRLRPSKWLVDKSPYSANDLQDPLPADPAPDELDYCLVRLSSPAGEESVGGSNDPGASKRGWLDLAMDRSAGTANDNIFIIQHPYDAVTKTSQPLKLAIGNHLGFAGGGLRMRYDADTRGGSSGSPVFNADLEVIGLHHRGDPNADGLRMQAKHNQGIPIRRIVALLAQRQIEQFWI